MKRTDLSDRDVRHFIYHTFAATALPPTAKRTAEHFGASVADAEDAFRRLAGAHQIALAPGSHAIWMAHPFSAIPTDYRTQQGKTVYYANCAWDVLGIAAILQQAATGYLPCGCGLCSDELVLSLHPGESLSADWIVHFVVPARHFWDDIGYT